jgi:hypothetical protein
MTNLEDRIQTYLDAIPPAISRLGGHDQTFKVACRLVNGFALSPEQAIHWLRVYNGKCDPPWSEADLLHKVESAFAANHRGPRGYLLGDGRGAAAMSQGWSENAASMPATPKWPQPDTVMIEEICRDGISLAALHDASHQSRLMAGCFMPRRSSMPCLQRISGFAAPWPQTTFPQGVAVSGGAAWPTSPSLCLQRCLGDMGSLKTGGFPSIPSPRSDLASISSSSSTS